MELNWSTFVLEIINFLVLVWILKHFFYKPVLDVIARRRAAIEKTLSDAKDLHTDAEKLQTQYEGRLADWDQERRQMRDALSVELETERAQKMAGMQTAMEQEQEKMRVVEASRENDARRKLEETALIQSARFATRLLEQASGPDTEAHLVELVITELAHLPAERITALRKHYGEAPEAIVISSAYPLPDDQRQRLQQALATVTDADIPLQFEQNKDLLAGVRITIGTWVLGANLRDELQGFTELAHDD